MKKDNEVTWVLNDVCVCNNCGQHSDKPENIVHCKTCKAGESKKWEKYYEKANEEELNHHQNESMI